MKGTRVAVGLLLLLSATLAAIPIPVDVENVPVERVVANLERQISEQPKDADLRVNLARVHAMAFALKVATIPSATPRYGGATPIVPWVGGVVPSFQPFDVRPSNDPAVDGAAKGHLAKAVTRYREAIEIAPTNMVAKLGLGWTSIQAGDKPGAVATLRELVAQSTPKDPADGRSDRGEVRSVTEWGIVSLSCEYEFDRRHPDEIAMSPRGVTFTTGETRPTFDLILRSANVRTNHQPPTEAVR